MTVKPCKLQLVAVHFISRPGYSTLQNNFFDELIKTSKDASRTKAIEMYPSLADKLSKKKDVNKSDAILIARFFAETGIKDE